MRLFDHSVSEDGKLVSIVLPYKDALAAIDAFNSGFLLAYAIGMSSGNEKIKTQSEIYLESYHTLQKIKGEIQLEAWKNNAYTDVNNMVEDLKKLV